MARIRRTGARIYGANVISTLPRPFGVMLDEAERIDRQLPDDPPLTPVFLSTARAEEVRRRFFRPALLSSRVRVQGRQTLRFEVPTALQLRVPDRVRFCLRRKQRKEVLFARRKIGFSGATRGPYRRTGNSLWRC